MTRRQAQSLLILFFGITSVAASTEDEPLTLADLEAYRVALASKVDPKAPKVRFRDLWERPAEYNSRKVRVEGKVGRVFRQPRFWEFPPLTEAWIVSEADEPICLVYPTDAVDSPEVGSVVGFSGTFLKKVKYQGGDAARVAPLVVGPLAPSSLSPATGTGGMSWSSMDWLMALAGVGVVSAILARRHFSKPAPAPPAGGPPPIFVDGGSDFDADSQSNETGS